MVNRRRAAKSNAGGVLDEQSLKRYYVVLAIAFVLDMSFSIGIFISMRCFEKSWFDFETCGGIEIVLSLLRCVVVCAITFVGIKYGKALDEDVHKVIEVNDSVASSGVDESYDSAEDDVELLGGDSQPALTESQRASLERRSMLFRNGSLILLFCVLTASQVAVGVKATVAPLSEDVVNRVGVQWMVCLLIAVCNLELWLTRRIVDSMTREKGVYVKTSHSAHRLFLKKDLGWVRCDRCHQRISDPRCYSCGLCDWDVCFSCLRKDLKKEERSNSKSEESSEETDLTFSEYARLGLKLIRPHIVLVVLALVCLLVRQSASIVLPSFTGQILDSVITSNASTFRTTLTAFISINIALGVVSGVSRLLFAAVAQRMERHLRTQLFERILMQEIEYFDSATTGDLLAKLHDDTRTMLSPIQYYLMSVLGFLLSIAGGLIMCIRTSWRLSILAFTILGPLTMITSTYSSWASKLWSQVWGLHSTMTDTAKEAFSLIRTVRAFGREQVQVEQYNMAAGEKLKMGMKDAWASGGTAAITQYMELALQALVLSYGGISILHGSTDLSVGGLITFQLYWNMLSGAFQGVFDQINQFTKATGAAQRVIRLMERLPEVDPKSGVALEGPLGDIELDNVWFRYKSRPENVVLKGVSLKIPRGSVCALVGRSGGGKSTILSLLCRNYTPEKGHISVGGIDLNHLRPAEYRRRLGIVQQDTELFNESVERNITYGVDEYTREELLDAARNANCLDFINGFDEGFATKVGERGVKISGGQKQRIAIARVMIKRPELLLMDEATSNLDSESEHLVQESIDRLMKNGNTRPTVVLVAHRLSTVINADNIAVVDNGIIAEQGTHEELMRKQGIYARLVERQLASKTLDHDGTEKLQSIDDLFDGLKGKEEK